MQYETITAVSPCGCELDRSACLARLAGNHLGHLGLTAKALPVVSPIRCRLIAGALVFATASRAQLSSAHNRAVACIEVSGVDDSTREEWSILATGRLREVDDPTSIWPDESPMPPAWGTREARRFVALDIELVSGTTAPVAG